MSDCRCGWDVEFAQLCTETPGVLHPAGGYLTLCAPESACTDAVVHRTEGTGWHTRAGTTVSDWYRRRVGSVVQLPLFEVAA